MKHELLAPAGSLKTFYAVVNAGADAVYVGGPRFGARAYAQNFTTEELIEAITYGKLHGVKVYMTVNTLVKESEVQDCIEMMIPFYEAGLAGVIIQDVGIIRTFRKHFPKMELHASTQMSVSNVEGANLLKEAGICRVVPSRELSLTELKEIHDETGMELETFIHGALCYCYSGQCLFSSFIGGRSGNRGRCAQPCRLPYEAFDENNRKIFEKGELFSLKDLCTLQFLPEILESGVYSLKIEGRMKQTSYAYTVVSIYRKYLDLYDEKGKEGYQVSKKDYEALLKAGNRDGFTNGYYKQHNGKDMLTGRSSAHVSSEGILDENLMCRKKQVPISGSCKLQVGEPVALTVKYKDVEVAVTGATVQAAENKGILREQIKKQLQKTGSTPYVFGMLDIAMDDGIFLPVSSLNQLRREALEVLTRQICGQRLYEAPNAEEETSHSIMAGKENVSVLVRTKEQLFALMDRPYISRIYLEITAFSPEESKALIPDLFKIRQEQVEIYLALPYIFRKRNKDHFLRAYELLKNVTDGFLARSYDSLGFVKEQKLPFVTDASLYCFHTEAVRFFKDFSAWQTTVPVEITRKEMKPLLPFTPELIVYGRIPLMISAGCVKKNTAECKKKSETLFVKDRMGYVFPVVNECNGCYNVLYNSKPTCLFNDKTSFDTPYLRLQFSTEDESEVNKVLALFEKQVLGFNTPAKALTDFTWGHYKKGVE